MKLSCLQENLNKGLNIVSRLVATKGTLEILSHILLKSENGILKLSATNLEVGINYKVGSKIHKDGSITVPAKIFSELVSQIPEGKLDISEENNTLYIESGNIKSHIKGLSAEDFPLIPKVKESKLFSVSSHDIKKAILLVSFASQLDDSRPVLSGVYIKVEKGKLTLAATDSYRLAEKIININGGEETKEIIIPARSMVELARILDDSNKEVNFYADENQVMFETDEFEFTSRLVEGKFPDYKQIIPEAFETKALVNLSDMLNIVRVASLFSGESSVNLILKSEGKIETTSSSSQFGDSNAAAEAIVEGKDAEIVFNSRYILDVLSNLGDEKISIEVNGKLNPGVIRKDGDKSYIYVIMPLRA